MAQVKGFLQTPQTEAIRNRRAPQVSGLLQSTDISQPAPPSLVTSAAGPLVSGLAASQAGGVGTDLTSGILTTGVSTLAGAAGGALTGATIGALGGPIGVVGGAVIGGGAAFLTSALNSWLSISSENKRKKETQKFIKELEAKNAKKEVQARQDSLRQFKFNRSDIERNQAINAFNTKRTLMMDAINNNQALKDRFIQTGVR
jgi:phage tail tape-measure protein